MDVGIQISSFNWSGSPENTGVKLAEIARTADEVGFASIWTMDHFFQSGFLGPAEDPMLEAYSSLSFLAAVTRRAKLGTMVTGVIYRNPGVLIKTMTTLDVLSGGRAYLGIGAASHERESLAMGTGFPPLKERFERLEEALQIAHQMWSDNNGAYEGKHYQLAETLNQPQPLSKPHPPIIVGGMGEKKTLRLVAKYADGCNFFSQAGEQTMRQKLDTLKRYCDELERPYEQIERTAMAMPSSPKQFIEQCRSLAQMGIQHVIVAFRNAHELTPIEAYGREVIPAVAEF